MKKVTNNFRETQELAKEFVSKLHGGDVLLLFGDLGSGKTTFMQGLAEGIGLKRRIISPTFIIVRRYEIPSVIASEAKQSNKNKIAASSSTPRNDIGFLYHIDLYRTQTMDDLKGLGLLEILQEKDAIVAIEWPEKLKDLFPKKRWELHFDNLGEDSRSITIEKYE
ncbi:MAG TPA: tRNA (adenosine(37)-N6)-threonylcarbamoyltransferase complex ATPase subunit type 1 TsaE [Patescibacteria group bacterium]|nr:tRNA (adenosine(37)-N6)-threonylcarbamoyltransferase complex ATPase subunit type 1 TsaE [Patescibacteria group bacterium]